jgi:hypothetical protein
VSQTIEDLFSKLAPVLGEQKMNRLWLLYQTETDLEKRREIEGIVHSLAAKHLNENYSNNRMLLPPPAISTRDGYHFGKIHYGDEARSDFLLPENHLLLHCGIFGATGTGKTNLGFLLVKQLLGRKIPLMIFDWKRNYRDVLETDWGKEKEIVVYTVARDVVPFSFDPLSPPDGTDQQAWESKMIDILCHSHFLGHGVRYWLKILLSGVSQHSMQALLNAIRQTKAVGRPRQWLDSALRAVGDLCIGQAAKVFNSTSNAKIDELLSRNVVFELDALPEDSKKFFTEVLLAYIHQYRLNRQEREALKHVILVEEAHHILFREKEYQATETIMDIVFREIRELSEAIVICDQHPSEISKPALGNTGTTIILRLKHADDVRAAADTLLLDFKQRNYVGQLPTGWAIVKAPDVPKPFLIKIPLVEVKKGYVTDEMLKEKFQGYSAASKDIPPPQQADDGIPTIPPADKEGGRATERLTDEEMRFLEDVIDHPASGVVERYQRLKLGMQKGTNLKDSLERSGFIRQHRISTGDAAIRYLEVTDAGFQVLTKFGHGCQRSSDSPRRGGPEHRYWIGKIADELRSNGFQVQTECPIGSGKTVDIVAEKNGHKIAIEVETGRSDTVKNVEKSIRNDFDKVIVVSTSEWEKSRLADNLFHRLLDIQKPSTEKADIPER